MLEIGGNVKNRG